MIEIDIPGFSDMTHPERREALWGLRNGSAMHMNRIRREGFESLKALITERVTPKVIAFPLANVRKLPAKARR